MGYNNQSIITNLNKYMKFTLLLTTLLAVVRGKIFYDKPCSEKDWDCQVITGEKDTVCVKRTVVSVKNPRNPIYRMMLKTDPQLVAGMTNYVCYGNETGRSVETKSGEEDPTNTVTSLYKIIEYDNKFLASSGPYEKMQTSYDDSFYKARLDVNDNWNMGYEFRKGNALNLASSAVISGVMALTFM